MPDARQASRPEPAPDLTLDPHTYAVLLRVPLMWWDQADTIAEIAAALHRTKYSVRGSLEHLIRAGLIERRTRHTITPTIEVRRVGK